jgi:hypothetical protein
MDEEKLYQTVRKRDGHIEPFSRDKLRACIIRLSYGLTGIDADAIASEVAHIVRDGVSTSGVAAAAARQAASRWMCYPGYETLAARITVADMHRDCQKRLSTFVDEAEEFLTPSFVRYVRENATALDGAVVHVRDYDLPYETVLEMRHLLLPRERPQNLYMRAAIAAHLMKSDCPQIASVIRTYEDLSRRMYILSPWFIRDAGRRNAKPESPECAYRPSGESQIKAALSGGIMAGSLLIILDLSDEETVAYLRRGCLEEEALSSARYALVLPESDPVPYDVIGGILRMRPDTSILLPGAPGIPPPWSIGLTRIDRNKHLDGWVNLSAFDAAACSRLASLIGPSGTIGAHGLSDLLAKECIAYDSQAAVERNLKIFATFAEAAHGVQRAISREAISAALLGVCIGVEPEVGRADAEAYVPSMLDQDTIMEMARDREPFLTAGQLFSVYYPKPCAPPLEQTIQQTKAAGLSRIPTVIIGPITRWSPTSHPATETFVI